MKSSDTSARCSASSLMECSCEPCEGLRATSGQLNHCDDICGLADKSICCCSFGFVGSVKRCPGFCEFQRVGPNGGSAADGIASIFAHELSEIISDPDATAWCATSPASTNLSYLCRGLSMFHYRLHAFNTACHMHQAQRDRVQKQLARPGSNGSQACLQVLLEASG